MSRDSTFHALPAGWEGIGGSRPVSRSAGQPIRAWVIWRVVCAATRGLTAA